MYLFQQLGNHSLEVKNFEDFPDCPHFVIMVFEKHSYTIPGDERSRTNPGHGYPAEHVNMHLTKYHAYADKQEWINAIKRIEGENAKSKDKTVFKAFAVSAVAQVGISVNVSVE